MVVISTVGSGVDLGPVVVAGADHVASGRVSVSTQPAVARVGTNTGTNVVRGGGTIEVELGLGK